MRRTPLTILIAVVLAALSLGLVACGGDDDSSDAEPPPATTAPATTAPATTAPADTTATTAPAGGTLEVAADPSGGLAFTQTTLTTAPGPTTIVLTNDAPVPHNIAVEGPGVDTEPSETIQGGGTAELSVDLPAGEYEYYCAVAGHREGGMEGTLTVE